MNLCLCEEIPLHPAWKKSKYSCGHIESSRSQAIRSRLSLIQSWTWLIAPPPWSEMFSSPLEGWDSICIVRLCLAEIKRQTILNTFVCVRVGTPSVSTPATSLPCLTYCMLNFPALSSVSSCSLWCRPKCLSDSSNCCEYFCRCYKQKWFTVSKTDSCSSFLN